ncbi:MAG TPA: hypothetical protein DCP11_06130, partial [Microbacteriaceae bacterium]|nr:hypothetical protein [Microbacteriaceae bacterium]
ILAGCTKTEPIVTPAPTPSSTPLFASDADALEAATGAYAAYLKVSDQILMDGGVNPERIASVATKSWAAIQMASFAKERDRGWRSTGGSTFDGLTLQQQETTSRMRVPVITAYVCVDVSAVDVFGRDGVSVVSEDRPDRSPVEVSFELAESTSKTLLVADESSWSGPGVC